MSAKHSSETITDAEALLNKICSFRTVLPAHIFRQIFAITTPASLYLQSVKIDILSALRSVETAEVQLGLFRNKFASILKDAKDSAYITICKRKPLQRNEYVRRRGCHMRTLQIKLKQILLFS